MSIKIPRRKKPQKQEESQQGANIILDEHPQNVFNEQNDPINNYNHFQSHETTQLLRRMRQRHYADGAISINLEQDDLSNDNYSIYDDKYINFDKPKINENISKENIEHYIESIHHDQFFKITQPEQPKPPTDTTIQGTQLQPQLPSTVKQPSSRVAPSTSKRKKKSKKPKRPLTTYELSKITESKIFAKFDEELNEVINKTISKVNLLFLFTQGLLAGMAISNLILFSINKDLNDHFKEVYPKMSVISFELFHTLTFASLVGNGIKFITAFQKYELIKNKFNSNDMSMFTLLKKNMIFSGILLVCFTISFGLEIYLATVVLTLNYWEFRKSNSSGTISGKGLMDNKGFETFRIFYIIIDIMLIVWFILNIFDVNLKEDSEKIVQAKVNINYYMDNPNDDETNEDDDEEGELID